MAIMSKKAVKIYVLQAIPPKVAPARQYGVPPVVPACFTAESTEFSKKHAAAKHHPGKGMFQYIQECPAVLYKSR